MKRLNIELVNQKLAGRTLVAAFPLLRGGTGLLFEGDIIVDLKGYILDQAESVRELAVLKSRLTGLAVFMTPAKHNPQHVVSRIEAQPPKSQPADEPKIFDTGWEHTGASIDERENLRLKALGIKEAGHE